MRHCDLLTVPAIAALAIGIVLGACASDEPDAVVGNDSGNDASLLGDATPPDAEAGVPLGDPCGDATGLEKDAPWPMRGGCPKRAGTSAVTGPQGATIKWSVPLPVGDSSPAIGADHVVWVGTTEGDVVLVSPDGVPQGALRTGGAVRSSPARSATNLTVIASTDGTLYGVDRGLVTSLDGGADGGDAGVPPARAIWSHAVTPMTSSPAIGADGTIYVGTTAGQLVAVAADGSATKWSVTTNDTAGASPCLSADGTVYLGSADHKLYAITPGGTIAWSLDLGAAAGSPLVGGDETIYVSTADGKLHAVAPDGKPRWTYAAGGPISGAPAVRAGVVYVGSDDKKLHAIATTTGVATWTYATLGAVATPVIGADGVVYVGSTDGNLYAIAPSGLLFFAVKAKGKIHSAPALGDGVLYVTTDTALLAIGQ